MLGNLKLYIPIKDRLLGAIRHLASYLLLRDGKRIMIISNLRPKVIILDFLYHTKAFILKRSRRVL